MRRGDRAGAKIVCRGGAAEGQFHMRVRVDAARNDELAGGVYIHIGFHLELGANGGDLLAVDEDVGFVVIGSSDDLSVRDQGFHDGREKLICLLERDVYRAWFEINQSAKRKSQYHPLTRMVLTSFRIRWRGLLLVPCYW